METLSNKGIRCIILDGNKFTLRHRGHKRWTWRCTHKNCRASIHTDAEKTDVIEDPLLVTHSHNDNVQDISYAVAKANCKRKAEADFMCRPSKILRNDETVKKSVTITSTNVKNIGLAMYRSRRRSLPALPTSGLDLIFKLRAIESSTCKKEDFLLVAEMLKNQ